MDYTENKKIDGLDRLTDTTIASDDLIVIGDVSDSHAKAITLADLEEKMLTDLGL